MRSGLAHMKVGSSASTSRNRSCPRCRQQASAFARTGPNRWLDAASRVLVIGCARSASAAVPEGVRMTACAEIVARARDDVWAVGETADGHPLIDHWTGKGWEQVGSDAPPQVTTTLVAATVTPDGSVVVFGSDYPGGVGGGYQGPADQAN